MIMDARTAAELLYESEAALRMVDTVLDDLHIGELEPNPNVQGLWALRTDGEDGGDVHAPPEFCVRGYWQVHELMECVRQAREVISPAGQQAELQLGEAPENARLDRVLSMIDALDSLDESTPAGRAELLTELRREIGGLVGGASVPTSDVARARTATALLSEAEVRLTRLGHMFEQDRI